MEKTCKLLGVLCLSFIFMVGRGGSELPNKQADNGGPLGEKSDYYGEDQW